MRLCGPASVDGRTLCRPPNTVRVGQTPLSFSWLVHFLNKARLALLPAVQYSRFRLYVEPSCLLYQPNHSSLIGPLLLISSLSRCLSACIAESPPTSPPAHMSGCRVPTAGIWKANCARKSILILVQINKREIGGMHSVCLIHSPSPLNHILSRLIPEIQLLPRAFGGAIKQPTVCPRRLRTVIPSCFVRPFHASFAFS